jgi:long-chain fatty acid transport protein
MRRVVPVLLGLCGASSWASTAAASGFDAPTLGSAQSGPVARDAAATWWNPGRLTALDLEPGQAELQVGLGVIVGSIGYQRDIRAEHQYADNLDFKSPVATSDLDPNKFGKQKKVGSIPLGPAFDAYVAIPAIRDRLVFGLGIGIPYVAVLNFPENGPQRFAGQSIFLATPHATLAAAVKLHRVISIGAGVSYVLGTMSLSKVQDFGEVSLLGDALSNPPIGQDNDFGPDAPPEVRELDVLARPFEIKQAFAHGVSFNAGIALQPTDKLSIGLVYHHGAKMTFRGKFRLDMNDDFFTQDLAAQGLQYPALLEGKARVRLRLPKRITLGAGYQITPKFALDGFVSYVTYQDFDRIRIRLTSPDLAQPALGIGESADQDLVRNWKGAVATEVSGRISATKKLLVSVTAGYNSPASPDSTLDVFSPDGHRIILGSGIVYRFTDRAALLADLEGQFIVPRTTTTSTYDLGNGTYSLFLAAATIHGQFKFAGRGGAKGKGKTKGKAEPAPTTTAAPATQPTEPTETASPTTEPLGTAPSPSSGTPPPPPPPAPTP